MLDYSQKYRIVWILESRAWWPPGNEYDPSQDLVLTYDFALHRDVESLGGAVYYVDHLVEPALMQENNFRVYHFFNKWHLDQQGKDIFEFRCVPFGFAFRLDIWNDLLFFSRSILCLAQLRKVIATEIRVGIDAPMVHQALVHLGIAAQMLSKNKSDRTSYYFPIFQWMDERVRQTSWKANVKNKLTGLQFVASGLLDRLRLLGKRKAGIFLQEYHPTRRILARLQDEKRFRISLMQYSSRKGVLKYVVEHPIPIARNVAAYHDESKRLLQELILRHCHSLILTDNIDITEPIYEIILARIVPRCEVLLCTLASVQSYLKKHPIQLMVMIANLGLVNVMVDLICRVQKVPRYLIINGILGSDFYDEGKYADVINSYCPFIRDHYFSGMTNIVTLGDPRMDVYAHASKRIKIERIKPTITIGAAGFNSADLNSYVAFEFDFLADILSALRVMIDRGMTATIQLKVRSNGYAWQYQKFVDEYFADLNVAIFDQVPMIDVLHTSDLYLSIYSQTIIEAAALGIPGIYYRKDNEIMDAPFDGNCELVTVSSVGALVTAFEDFRTDHPRFHAFLQTSTIEKYIGPLDGNNVERNVQMIYAMAERGIEGAKSISI